MEDKVSVIIPTYKRADVLDRAIKSVLNQTYNNIEIIVVDDNDENSEYRKENEKKMEKYSNFSNIFYLKHSKNKNGAAARNTGIRKATGDFITFLDDDDFFLPKRIEKMVNILKKNPEYGCAYSSVAFLNNNEINNVIIAEYEGDLTLMLLKQYSFFGTGSNMFFRRSIITKIGYFDEQFLRHQDIEYMIRFFKYSKIIPLNEILVVKCFHDSNNIPDFKKMLEMKELFFSKFNKEIDKFPLSKNDIYFENYISLVKTYMKDKNNYKYIISKISNYKKTTLKLRMKFIYIKYFSNLFIVKKINKLRKKRKLKKYISNKDLNEIMSLSRIN